MAEEKQKEKLRIGILGAANIARKNCIAISHPESNCIVTAIASRTTEKAKQLYDDCFSNGEEIKFFGDNGMSSYDELIQSDSCDAVYIPLPSSLHKEWVIKTIEAGKHILLEKPVALSTSDWNHWLQMARNCGIYIQDGTMFVHHARTKQVAESDEMKFQRIEANFTFCGDESFFQNDIRARATNGDPLGCIGDLGWYCIRMALIIWNNKQQTATTARVLDYKLSSTTNKDDAVPISATCLVKFGQEKTLYFHCSFLESFRQTVEMIGMGNSARLTINDFVLPKEAPVSYSIQSMKLTKHDLITLHENKIVECNSNIVQEVQMWQTFGRIAQGIQRTTSNEWCGTTVDEANRWATMTSHNQAICNALMQSIEADGKEIDIIL